MKKTEKLIFEKSYTGTPGFDIPEGNWKNFEFPVGLSRKKAAVLPEISELETVRHYTGLSRLNFSVDTHFYPLGSCTMKYNPKFIDRIAADRAFCDTHPMLSFFPETSYIAPQLEIIVRLEELLSEITGMDAVTTQPMAGAQGEMTGMMLIHAYHRAHGNNKSEVIIPDSSHGTNPASARMAGYSVRTIPSLENGEMDVDALKKALSEKTAAIMMTCPNTLGIFEHNIEEIAALCHEKNALMYYDGANLNAILGRVRPGDIGFDVVHINTHKTFATPHGGGGPGAGPIAVKRNLAPFLPVPRVRRKNGGFEIIGTDENSIGSVSPFWGNFTILLRALAYILKLGREGLLDVSEKAVLNAKYIRARLSDYYDMPFKGPSMHECVFSASRQTQRGVHALDIAKFLLDKGFHAPTVYFPLIVKEAIMVEPTETESKDTMDRFIDAMIEADKISQDKPETFRETPVSMPISRPDETRAARDLKIRAVFDEDMATD